MKTYPGIFLVIPVFNEEVIIQNVIHECRRAGFSQIIVVDDGSDDKTYMKVKQSNVILLRHILNRGKGAAIKTGMEAAKLLGAEIIVTLDGDGQHNPKDIDHMLAKIQKGYDVVLGSRLFRYKGMPFMKIVANYAGNFFTWLIYGVWVSDSQSGLRAYAKRAFTVIDTKHDRYAYDSEIIREIARHKLTYCEVPIEIRYTDYSTRKITKQTVLGGIKTLIRIIISS